MTPREKAQKILDMFYFPNLSIDVTSSDSKQCALICVDEIIEAIDWHEFETPNTEFEYWNEVKKEIERL